MTTATLTFDELARLEPRLRDLARDIERCKYAHRRKRNLCANGIWYGSGRFWTYQFRKRLTFLVGWYRSPGRQEPTSETEAVLRSVEAFDCAYDHLYHLLPDCRNCSCL